MRKLPAFQFYPGDWMKDPNLRRCSRAARGMWADMLCLMFECEDRGVLSTGGQPWSDEDIAVATGGDISEGLSCLAELLRKGVAYRNDAGAIFCKRMVRDEQERKANRKRVAKHRATSEDKSEGVVKLDCNGGCNADVTPPSSSSSSSSSSKININTAPTVTPAGVAHEDNFYDGKELWEVGKELLVNQGMSLKAAGAFIGKLCRDHGKPQVLEAVREALVNNPVDVASYLPGVLKKRKGVNGTEFKDIKQLRHEALVHANAAKGEEWLRRREKERAINEGRVINGEVESSG